MPPKSAGKSREIVLRALPGPNDACKDGSAADGGPQGHAFSQKRGGGKEGEDGVQVHVIGRGDVPQLLHHQVPEDKTD